jgi:hypothetical protein
LGAERIEDLRRALKYQEEGPGPDGHNRSFHTLAGWTGLRIDRVAISDYDLRVVAYETRLAKIRRAQPFHTFKHFQYLALLHLSKTRPDTPLVLLFCHIGVHCRRR